MALIIEIVLLLALGFPATYFVWVAGGRKGTFMDFLNKYGYAIAVIAMLLMGTTWTIINELQEP